MDILKSPIILIEAVNALLNKCDSPATLTIEQCASQMAMSMTSFRRKLSQEETTYKIIQSKFLNELCVHNLLINSANIDRLAIKLGYSERASFERAFRKKFGITPSQFQKLSLVGSDKYSRQNLMKIAQNMPPMPDSCQQLLHDKDQEILDIDRVVTIIEKDPIFVGRVLGLASKAIYGKTPSNIHEAISRNLGINTVVNLAVIYAIKEALQEHVNQVVINQYTQSFLIAPKLFRLVLISSNVIDKADKALIEQVLIFALIGVFLLSHRKAPKHKLMLCSLQGIADLHSLNHHVNESMGISIYSASSLMLSLWHIDARIIKKLTYLDKVSKQPNKRDEQSELILFMLSCLYFSAKKNTDYSELERKAELLNINNFVDIKVLLSNSE